MRKGTCCAISWVWWWFLPHQPWLIPFPSLSGSVLPADGSLKAAILYPSLSRRHLGFLHRMGTAEGAVGQASPRLSRPVCSRPSPDPPADLTSPSVRIPPAALRPPQAWGVRACLGTRTEREREGCVAQTPPPAPAEHWCIWESKSDAACFYITDLMGFVVLAYILMLQLSLAVSETSRPPPVFLLCIFFLRKKESNFPFFPRFLSVGLNKVSFILEQEGFLVVCGMNERGLFLPLAQLNRESVSQIILFQFWKKCVCYSIHMHVCLHAHFRHWPNLHERPVVVCLGKYKYIMFVAFLWNNLLETFFGAEYSAAMKPRCWSEMG